MKERKDYGWGVLMLMIAVFIAVLFLWNTWVVFPLKVFVVFLHEVSHGLAAVLTGGKMLRIEITPQLGGTCWTEGGSRWLILSAGYLGSMLFGGLILISASRTRLDKTISLIVGTLTILGTVLFVRSPFGIVFGVVFGVALVLVGLLLSTNFNDVILRFIGMVSSLYAVIDILNDLIIRTVPGSDAFEMSKLVPLPPVVWGIIWIVIAILATIWSFRIAAKGERVESKPVNKRE